MPRATPGKHGERISRFCDQALVGDHAAFKAFLCMDVRRQATAGARTAMLTPKLGSLCQPQGIINVFGMGIFMISAAGLTAAGFGFDLPLAGQALAAAFGMAIGVWFTRRPEPLP